MFHFNIRENKGQTIIEALVALSALVLILGAISVAVTTSLNNSVFIKDQTASAKYTQEGMSYIKYVSKNDPVTFKGFTGNQVYCFNDQNQITLGGAGGCSVNVASTYKREVEFTYNTTQCSGGAKATVTTYWTSGRCKYPQPTFCHKSQLITCFSDQSSSGTAL